MKINIGAGNKHYAGYVNCDYDDHYNPEYVFDLEQDLWPVEDNSVTHVIAYHVLEHLGEGYFHALKELYRVCAPGAIIDIKVPHYNHHNFHHDPTHRRAITPYGLKLFSRRFNDENEQNKIDASSLAYFYGVDFELCTEHCIIDIHSIKDYPGWTHQQFLDYSREHVNIISEFHIRLIAIKGTREDQIRSCYLNILDREADDVGFEHHNESNRSVGEIAKIFFESDEYKNSKTADSITEAFSNIYDVNFWKHGSGHGSLVEQVPEYVRVLTETIKKYNIKTVLDYGCGDWQFSQHINWAELVDSYTGVDVVDNLIQHHQRIYSTDKIKFETVTTDWQPPKVDLIICKDVLQHLPNDIIKPLLESFERSADYILLTNDVPDGQEWPADCAVGDWRPIDFTQAPWNKNATTLLKWYFDSGFHKDTLLIETNLINIQYNSTDFTFKVHNDDDKVLRRELLYAGVYEPELSAIWYQHIQPGDLVLDIGANIGWYTKLAELRGASVIAVEPDPKNFKLLKQNSSNLVEIHNICAGATTDDVQLKLSDTNPGDNRTVLIGDIVCRQNTIDNIVGNRASQIRAIKIDTQGWEPKIITGAVETLKQVPDDCLIIIEYWPWGLCQNQFTKDSYWQLFEIFNTTPVFIPHKIEWDQCKDNPNVHADIVMYKNRT